MFKQAFSKQNRALLAELVRTDFKLRYQGSVLGYAWSLLKPLMMFAILYMVFTQFLKFGASVPHFPVYLLLGIIMWNFFAETTGQSLVSVVSRGDLIRKIRIPRWIIVFSASISALINLGLNLIIVAIFLVINKVDIGWSILLLPFSLAQIYILALGLGFYLSAAYVKYRDIVNIWEVIIQAGFYLTPIIYSLSQIPDPLFQKLLLLNPMAQAIQDGRYNVVTDQTVTTWGLINNPWIAVIPLVLVVIIAVAGMLYFKKESKHFAENL